MRPQRLSIVIPCLNEAESIGCLLESLQPLRQRGHEVILVDGGSHDDTVRIAGPMVDRLLHSAPGRATQMNRGATMAEGGVLWFLHADTVLPAGAAEAVIDGVASGALWGRFDVQLSGSHPLLRMVACMMNLRSRWTAIATGDQGIFVRRDLFIRLGGFPDVPLMEDVVLSRRLKRVAGPLCLRLKLTTSSRRWERRGICRTVLLMWWLRLAFALGVSPKQLAGWYRPVR